MTYFFMHYTILYKDLRWDKGWLTLNSFRMKPPLWLSKDRCENFSHRTGANCVSSHPFWPRLCVPSLLLTNVAQASCEGRVGAVARETVRGLKAAAPVAAVLGSASRLGLRSREVGNRSDDDFHRSASVFHGDVFEGVLPVPVKAWEGRGEERSERKWKMLDAIVDECRAKVVGLHNKMRKLRHNASCVDDENTH